MQMCGLGQEEGYMAQGYKVYDDFEVDFSQISGRVGEVEQISVVFDGYVKRGQQVLSCKKVSCMAFCMMSNLVFRSPISINSIKNVIEKNLDCVWYATR